MPVRHVDSVSAETVEAGTGTRRQVLIGAHEAPNFAMRHYTVESGGHTPRHQHDYEHEVIVIEGTGQVECAGQKRSIETGDVVYLPANALHQFVNESETPFKFLCMVPVTFDCGKPTPGT